MNSKDIGLLMSDPDDETLDAVYQRLKEKSLYRPCFIGHHEFLDVKTQFYELYLNLIKSDTAFDIMYDTLVDLDVPIMHAVIEKNESISQISRFIFNISFEYTSRSMDHFEKVKEVKRQCMIRFDLKVPTEFKYDKKAAKTFYRSMNDLRFDQLCNGLCFRLINKLQKQIVADESFDRRRDLPELFVYTYESIKRKLNKKIGPKS